MTQSGPKVQIDENGRITYLQCENCAKMLALLNRWLDYAQTQGVDIEALRDKITKENLAK
jgi:hypothetical protein